MRRETIGTITFMLLLVITFAATYGVIIRLSQPKSQREEKFESADLVRYYVVERDSGPTFELRKSDRIIKLITHAELPAYEENARILYGFHVRIEDSSGSSYWETDIYTRTRQSKDRLVDGVYRDENTFNATGDTEYGDDRLLELRLPDGIRDGSRLEIRLLGQDDRNAAVERVLLRAYRRVRRSAVDRQIRAISMNRADKRQLADRVGLPWDLIPPDQRDSLITHRWDRMAALGEEDKDFDTRLVFYSGFRTRPEEDEDKLGIHVHELHAAAINVLVKEASNLTLVARRHIPGTAPRCTAADDARAAAGTGPGMDGSPADEEVVFQVDFVSDDDIENVRMQVPPGPDGIRQELFVPGGLYSLQFRTESPSGVVFCLRAARPDQAQFGYIRPIPIDADTEELIVDVRRLPAYYSDSREEQEPISTYIDGPNDIESRTFIIEVRTLMSGREWTDSKPRLDYRFLDSTHRVTAGGYTSLEPELAPFEKARMSTAAKPDEDDDMDEERPELEGPQETVVEGAENANPLASSATEEDSLLPLSEPLRFPVIAPIGARHLQVWSDRPSLIRVLANLGDRNQYEAPYCDFDPDTELLRWRYAPRERRRWFPTRPENRKLLADSNRIARIRVQVRLEPIDPSMRARSERVAVLLEPQRPAERQLVLEPVAVDNVADTIKEWPPGAYTKLSPRTRVSVTAKIDRRPKLRYFLNSARQDLLGLSVDVEIHHGDGEPIRVTRLLSTPRGIWTLPYLPEGRYVVRCAPSTTRPPPSEQLADALRANLDCYINVPPAPNQQSRIVRARTVYPLDHRSLRLVVDKKPGRDVVVNAVVYDERSDGRSDPYIYARIDGGQPRRTVGTVVSSITRAERWWPLPPARTTSRPIFVDLAGRTPGFPRNISMRLGDDLAVGRHLIDIEAPPLSGWVRFYTYDLDPREQESAWQWQFEAPDPGSRDGGGQ